MRAAALYVAVLSAGCSGDETSTVPDQELTLENCETQIDNDVPEFFARHFRCVAITMDGDVVEIATESLPPHRSYYYGSDHPNYAELAQ